MKMRLDKNERTTPLDANVFSEVVGNMGLEELAAYPELGDLYNCLAGHHGLDLENILLFNGSDSGIKSLFEVFVEPQDEVISLTPSYGMFFLYPKMFGAKLIQVGYEQDFSLPASKVIGKITDRTKLLLIANPNHTGTAISQAELLMIIEAAAEHKALVLIDEAYFEFHGETAIPLIEDHDNLVISRTMSKAYGIASLRVGYLISNAGNISNLDKVRATHEITGVSARFAEYLFEHPEVTENAVKEINAGKDYLFSNGEEIGIQAIPSRTNFMFMKLPSNVDGGKVVEEMKAQNICINGPFDMVPVEGMIRVTVGPPWQMEEFLGVLGDVMNG